MKKSVILIAVVILILLQAASQAWEIKLGEREMNGFIYIQPRYTFSPVSNDEFKLYRARIDLWGDISENLAYFLEADFVQSPSIIYAWADIKYDPDVTLRVGRFFYPFGLEYTTPPSKFDTINPTNVLWYYFGYSRDTGIEYKEKLGNVKYELAIVNGADNMNSDDNDSKDFVGRAVIEVEKGSEIGFSYYGGKAGTGTLEADRIRSGMELKYVNDKFSLKSEYITGFGYKNDSGVYQAVRGQGYYVQPAYMLTPELQWLLRFEEWDPSIEVAGDKKTVMLLGVNWFFDPAAKLQLNYEIKGEETSQTNNDVFLVQLQLNF